MAYAQGDDPDQIRLSIESEETTEDDERLSVSRNYIDARIVAVSKLLGGTAPELADWIHLGQVVDQGLCRPDVERFMEPMRHSEVLRPDPHSLYFDSSLTSYEIDFSPDPQDSSHSLESWRRPPPRPLLLSTTFREPGDLAPETTWNGDLRTAFKQVGIELDSIRQGEPSTEGPSRVSEILAAANPTVSHARVELQKSVNQWFSNACAAAGSHGSRLWVDQESNRPCIWFDNIRYEESLEVMAVFEVLKDHVGPEKPVGLRRALGENPLFSGRAKAVEIKKLIKASVLRDMIRSKAGRGTWLEFPANRQ